MPWGLQERNERNYEKTQCEAEKKQIKNIFPDKISRPRRRSIAQWLANLLPDPAARPRVQFEILFIGNNCRCCRG